MRKNGFAVFLILVISIVLYTYTSIPVGAQSLFTLAGFDCERFDDYDGNLLRYSVGFGLNLEYPQCFDHVTVTYLGNHLPIGELDWDGSSITFYIQLGQDCPAPGTTFTLTVVNTDGVSSSSDVEVTETSFSTETPVILHPVEGDILADNTPGISWEAFESPQKGVGESLSYIIEVNTYETWWRAFVSEVSEEIISVAYSDGTPEPGYEELPEGTYGFMVFAIESKTIDGCSYHRTSIRVTNATVAVTVGVGFDIKGPKFTSWNRAKFLTGRITLPKGYDFVDISSIEFQATGGNNDGSGEWPVITLSYGEHIINIDSVAAAKAMVQFDAQSLWRDLILDIGRPGDLPDYFEITASGELFAPDGPRIPFICPTVEQDIPGYTCKLTLESYERDGRTVWGTIKHGTFNCAGARVSVYDSEDRAGNNATDGTSGSGEFGITLPSDPGTSGYIEIIVQWWDASVERWHTCCFITSK
jgi:hypothetical protein